MIPFAAGTFFPFTSFRAPSLQRYRSQRLPPNNFISLQSPIPGLRIQVPRELLKLFNVRQLIGQEPHYYPRQIPFNPHPNFPRANDLFPHNYLPPLPLPPFDATAFINFMRTLYPDMIYRPDPRIPNVFAIRLPPESIH